MTEETQEEIASLQLDPRVVKLFLVDDEVIQGLTLLAAALAIGDAGEATAQGKRVESELLPHRKAILVALLEATSANAEWGPDSPGYDEMGQ